MQNRAFEVKKKRGGVVVVCITRSLMCCIWLNNMPNEIS
jgi:hypothetical protein